MASFNVAHAAEVTVISGDTFRIDAKEWRIANIDAPQIEHTCDSEMKLGLLAQAKLAEILNQGEAEIRPTGDIDARQRPMAHVRIHGDDVGEMMIAARLAQRHGHARPLCSTATFERNVDPTSPCAKREGSALHCDGPRPPPSTGAR